jgi:hypothetical protein
VDELELKVPSLRGDGFSVTSQAEAGEVLDVFTLLSFQRPRPVSGYPRKRPPLMEALGKK